MMRRRRYYYTLGLFALLCAAYLFTLACDDTNTGPVVGEGDVPAIEDAGLSSDATVVFEGENYRIVSVHLRETAAPEVDEYTQVGVISEASVPIEGEVPAYTRSRDEQAIYTPPLTEPQEAANENLLFRWLPLDIVEESEQDLPEQDVTPEPFD